MIVQAWTEGVSYSLWRIDALARPTGLFTLLARRLGHPFGQSAARALGGAMLPASCSKQQAADRAACSSTTVRFPTVITVRVLCRGSVRERFGSTVQVPRFSDRFSGHPVK